MLLGTDDIKILRGSVFKGTWQWQNEDTQEYEDFAGLTATIKIKNIDDEFENVQNTFTVGTAIVEPLDDNQNPFKGRIDITIPKTDTLKLAIPTHEEDRYGESGVYAILSITLSTGEVILQAKVTVVESLESEIYDYINDNYDIDLLASKFNEFKTVTIPAITTINNTIQTNKDIIEAFKIAVETIFDNFDDRYLGEKSSNPTLDNDSNALQVGAIYYNSVAKELRFYNGTDWDSPSGAAQTYALQASVSATTATTKLNEIEVLANNFTQNVVPDAIDDYNTNATTKLNTLTTTATTKLNEYNNNHSIKLAIVEEAIGNMPSYTSGTYTPTVSNTDSPKLLNIDTIYPFVWEKVQNMVTVKGYFTISKFSSETASYTITNVEISLPIEPVAFTNKFQVFADYGTGAKVGTTKVVTQPYTPANPTDVYIEFSYQV